MTQPRYVPIVESDQVREAYQVHAPRDWRADRPADLRGPTPRRRDFGTPGPDQGYGLLVAERLFADRVQVQAGESVHDALAAAAEIGGARAALFGRAPVGKDVEHALVLLGFLGDAPADLVSWRAPRVRSAAHEARRRRALVDAVPDATLRLTPDQVRARLPEWRTLLVEPQRPVPVAGEVVDGGAGADGGGTPGADGGAGADGGGTPGAGGGAGADGEATPEPGPLEGPAR